MRSNRIYSNFKKFWNISDEHLCNAFWMVSLWLIMDCRWSEIQILNGSLSMYRWKEKESGFWFTKKWKLWTTNKKGQNACTHKWLEANKLSCPKERCQSRGHLGPNCSAVGELTQFNWAAFSLYYKLCSGADRATVAYSGASTVLCPPGQHSTLLLISAH